MRRILLVVAVESKELGRSERSGRAIPWQVAVFLALILAPWAAAQTVPPEQNFKAAASVPMATAAVKKLLANAEHPDIARAIASLAAGDLREALQRAEAAHVKVDDAGKYDAALLRSFIFAKAEVWPLAAQWTHWVIDREPKNPGAGVLREMMSQRKVSAYALKERWTHSKSRAFQMDLYHGSPAAAQATVCVMALDQKFFGALAVEPLILNGAVPAFVMKYYDLEGTPLVVGHPLEKRPADAVLRAFVESLTPETGKGRYTLMRAELEALSAQELGITPFAARWAEYAGTKMVLDVVTKSLEKEHAANWSWWAWDAFGPWQPYGCYMVGYANRDVSSGALNDARGPLEEQHFAVFSRNPKVYLGSYVVASDEVAPGERVRFLKRVVLGRAQVITTYANVPSMAKVAAEIIRHLQNAAPGHLSGSTPLWIHDEFTADDLEAADFKYRKTYRIRMASGVAYRIGLQSDEFAPALRIADDQGKELARKEASGQTAQIAFRAPRTGDYQIIVTSALTMRTGRYSLTVGPEKAVAATSRPLEMEGELTANDEKDTVRTDSYRKVYPYAMKAGVKYLIGLVSGDFDPYLRLEDEEGKELAHDDDSGGFPNARMFFTAPGDGKYRIIATSYAGNTGKFRLLVREASVKAPVGEVPRGMFSTDSSLAPEDEKDSERTDSYRKIFHYQMSAGKEYIIDLTSDDFDAFLRLEDAEGKELARDDDSGGFLHARITFRAATDGAYRIIATTYAGGKTGQFTLKAREN